MHPEDGVGGCGWHRTHRTAYPHMHAVVNALQQRCEAGEVALCQCVRRIRGDGRQTCRGLREARDTDCLRWRNPCWQNTVPACLARTMAWARSATCNLAKALETWLRTVFKLIESRSAVL